MPTKNARICIYGGPGVGKSVMAAQIFVKLKQQHLPFELVDEVIKGMAWRKTQPEGYDSLWLFGKQLHREDIVLRSGGSVITAGSLLQQVGYMCHRKEDWSASLANIANEFESRYPALHINLIRNVPYQTEGRYQVDQTEAEQLDTMSEDVLKTCGHNYISLPPQDFDLIMDYVGNYLYEPI